MSSNHRSQSPFRVQSNCTSYPSPLDPQHFQPKSTVILSKSQSNWLSWSPSILSALTAAGLQSHIATASVALDASTHDLPHAGLDSSLGNELRSRSWLRDDEEAWRFIWSTIDDRERAAVGPGLRTDGAQAQARTLWVRLERRHAHTGAAVRRDALDAVYAEAAGNLHARKPKPLGRDVERRFQGFVSCAHIVRSIVPDNTFKHSLGFNMLST